LEALLIDNFSLFSLYTISVSIILLPLHAMLTLAPYTQHQSKGDTSLDSQVIALCDGCIGMHGICLFIIACLEARYNFHILKQEQYLLMIFKIFVNGHRHSCWWSPGLAQAEGRIVSSMRSAQVRKTLRVSSCSKLCWKQMHRRGKLDTGSLWDLEWKENVDA